MKINITEDTKQHSARYLQHLFYKTIIGFIAGLSLLFISMNKFPIIPSLNSPEGPLTWLIIGLMSFTALFYSAEHIFYNGWCSLKSYRVNISIFITLGTIIIWLYSMMITLFSQYIPQLPSRLYFETAVLLIASFPF